MRVAEAILRVSPLGTSLMRPLIHPVKGFGAAILRTAANSPNEIYSTTDCGRLSSASANSKMLLTHQALSVSDTNILKRMSGHVLAFWDLLSMHFGADQDF